MIIQNERDMEKEQVYVVIAIETGGQVDGSGDPVESAGCYCVCDSMTTAREIIDNDTARGDIYPGAYITSHVLQTKELI